MKRLLLLALLCVAAGLSAKNVDFYVWQCGNTDPKAAGNYKLPNKSDTTASADTAKKSARREIGQYYRITKGNNYNKNEVADTCS